MQICASAYNSQVVETQNLISQILAESPAIEEMPSMVPSDDRAVFVTLGLTTVVRVLFIIVLHSAFNG